MTKHWTVYILNASHMDPGWHDLPVRIMAMQAEFVDRAVELCQTTRHLPRGERFVFTIEHAYLVDYYQRRRAPRQFARLVECVRRGQLEIGAIYAGVHTDLCGHEELARLTMHAGRLRRQFRLPMDTAMLNDVSEGYTMGLPQVLARSGVKRLCVGPGVKAVQKGIQPRLPRIFWWQGTDGSKVLFAWTPGFWTYSDWKAAFEGRKTLEEFAALPDYPYETIFRHGGKGDNTMPTEAILKTMETHRLSAPEAEVRLGRMVDFFRRIESSAAAKSIPTFHGDNPHSWADGTLALARETGIHRRNQSELLTAEKLWALWTLMGSRDPYPGEQIRQAYRNLHLYSDHTWGLDVAADGKTDAKSIDVAEWSTNWDAKKEYATGAQTIAAELTENAVRRMSAAVAGAGESLVVWNPASWKRTEIVEFTWHISRLPPRFALIDPRSGREVAWEFLPAAEKYPHTDQTYTMALLAEDVPAMGHVVYKIQRRPPEANPDAKVDQANRIENKFYRVTVDRRRGVVKSIWDKRLRKELVDPKAEHGFNQYIHAHVDQGYEGPGNEQKSGMAHGKGKRYSPRLQGIQRSVGPVGEMLTMDFRLDRGPAPARVRSRIALYRDRPWVEIVNEVYKEPSARKEQIFFAFPIRVQGKPSVRVELPYAVMNWATDILPGCWRGYTSVAHWVDVSGKGYGVTISPREAPVVCLGGITANEWDPKWHEDYEPDNGHIYSYVMSNIWNCNYPLWQSGQMRFAYRLTSHAGACDQAAASRFGWGHATAMPRTHVARRPWVKRGGKAPEISVDADNVMITALKRAEDGRGWVARLYETGGRESTRCTVSFSGGIREVRQTNLVEEDEKRTPVRNGRAVVDLNSHQLLTLRFR